MDGGESSEPWEADVVTVGSASVRSRSALARRFQSVLVPEPSPAESITILRGLKEKYQAHHGVFITDAALVSAVQHAHRYLTERKLPDKASPQPYP